LTLTLPTILGPESGAAGPRARAPGSPHRRRRRPGQRLVFFFI